jgi:hypothetical protein
MSLKVGHRSVSGFTDIDFAISLADEKLACEMTEWSLSLSLSHTHMHSHTLSYASVSAFFHFIFRIISKMDKAFFLSSAQNSLHTGLTVVEIRFNRSFLLITLKFSTRFTKEESLSDWFALFFSYPLLRFRLLFLSHFVSTVMNHYVSSSDIVYSIPNGFDVSDILNAECECSLRFFYIGEFSNIFSFFCSSSFSPLPSPSLCTQRFYTFSLFGAFYRHSLCRNRDDMQVILLLSLHPRNIFL